MIPPRVPMTQDKNVDSYDYGEDLEWDWKEHFGRQVNKDDPIWKRYMQVAKSYDDHIVGTINNSMDILLIFSGLFSAVVTTLIVQSDGCLGPEDKATSVMLDVGRVIFIQIDLLVKNLAPSDWRPAFSMARYRSDGDSVNFPVILWYISLYGSLLVAGGAVCVKIWLLGYQRSNNEAQVPYHRAIHHQQSCANLQRWYIPEFGDLLACILLFNLVPFFYGCLLQFILTRTDKFHKTTRTLSLTATCVLAIYTAFLMFTIVIGIFVPKNPYRTPVSNLLRQLPLTTLRFVMSNPHQRISIILALIFGINGILVLRMLEAELAEEYKIDHTFSSIQRFSATLIVILFVGIAYFSIRSSSKVGRISRFTPAFCLLVILIWVTLSWVTFNQTGYRVWDFNSNFYAPFLLLIPFTLVIIALSHRFSAIKSYRKLPIEALIGCACGVLVVVVIGAPREIAQSALGWVSIIVLFIASINKETSIEEDTVEAEALGWLISQTTDSKTLHSALVCLPSIANTPLRRQIILERSRRTLAMLINASVDVRQQKRPIREGKRDNTAENFVSERESLLAFYLTCLAELSGVMASSDHPAKSAWNSLLRRVHSISSQWWWRRWDRLFITTPLHPDVMRGQHSPRDWYPWIVLKTLNPLQIDLDILSKNPNSYIRSVSRAVKVQLYPETTDFISVAQWLVIGDASSSSTDFCRKQEILVQLRMTTSFVINLYRDLNPPEPSMLRYLQRYCITALNTWTSAQSSQPDQYLEMALVLAYLITEDNGEAVFFTALGDPLVMKAARSIMALTRKYDRVTYQSSDGQLLELLVEAVLSAIARYLRISADTAEEISCLVQLEKVDGEVNEDSIVAGLRYLEYALFQIASQEWAPTSNDYVISSLDALFTIWDAVESETKSNPLGIEYDPSPLMSRLMCRATTCQVDLDKASAIGLVCRILDRVPTSVALSRVLDDEFFDIITSMAQSTSVTCRAAALSVLKNTCILCPQSVILTGEVLLDGSPSSKPVSPNQDTELSQFGPTAGPGYRLASLYEVITSQPSPLSQAISVSSNSTDINLISASIAITSSLVESPRLRHFVSNFIYRDGYAETLASVASSDNDELVPGSIRQSAIHLFARLWKLADERRNEEEMVERLETGYFTPEAFFGTIAKGIDMVVDQRGSIELECISLWIERLQATEKVPRAPATNGKAELVEALRRAVPFSSFGMPVEDDRATISLSLLQLGEHIDEPTSDARLTAA